MPYTTAGLRTVIVPAAGLGTRFLPATKTVPKELLPVVNRPGIELIAEEAKAAGATRLAVITAPSKDMVMRHFQSVPELEETLAARGKKDQLQSVQRAPQLMEVIEVIQEQPLGLGHAVARGEEAMSEDEDVVAVMLPDDLVLPWGALTRMAEVRREFGGSVLCAFDVRPEEVSSYGVFDIAADTAGMATDVRRVVGMVEKPAQAEAPSTFVATGRYLLDRAIFDALKRITPGKGGELQLTDAIELLISEGHPVHIVIHDGKRHDLGNPGGFIEACVDFGLSHPEYGPALRRYLTERLAQADDLSVSPDATTAQ